MMVTPKNIYVGDDRSLSVLLKPLKSLLTTRGKTTWFGPWLVVPFPFGVVAPTRDNGTNF